MADNRVFEWDEVKASSNLAKHGVSFADSVRVFRDPNLVELDASRPEDREPRIKALGEIQGRLFAVIYTRRAGSTRVISARRGNPTERKLYGPLRY
jgi:uncharacterized DUF497 family protein